MKRRDFLQTTGVGSALLLGSASELFARETESTKSLAKAQPLPADLDELTISELQANMKSGKYNSQSITRKYLERIDDIDKNGPLINSIIEINPEATAIAIALDRERKEKGPRGPLHGIPILIKDNIDTADRMLTTAGSLALLVTRPREDAFIVKRLREAGAVILGKTNLSEWANFRSTRSTSGWSARGGQKESLCS